MGALRLSCELRRLLARLGSPVKNPDSSIGKKRLAALLLKLPHNVGSKSAGVMLLAAWLIWPMALSEAAHAWWGAAQILPIAASQAGAKGGAAWQELVVKLVHIGAGLGLVVAWRGRCSQQVL